MSDPTRAERHMLRAITCRRGAKRFTVWPSAETGLQNFGQFKKAINGDATCPICGDSFGAHMAGAAHTYAPGCEHYDSVARTVAAHMATP